MWLSTRDLHCLSPAVRRAWDALLDARENCRLYRDLNDAVPACREYQNQLNYWLNEIEPAEKKYEQSLDRAFAHYTREAPADPGGERRAVPAEKGEDSG